MMTFLAHEHIFDATENWGGLGWGGVGWCGDDDCSSGKICVAPKDAFDPDSLSWLA